MKNTRWPVAALCAALVACSATTPRDAAPASAAAALEPERMSANSPMSASAPTPMKDRPMLATGAAPRTGIAEAAMVAGTAALDAPVSAPAPQPRATPAASKPAMAAAAKPPLRRTASPQPQAPKAPVEHPRPAAAARAAPVAAPATAARSLTGRMELVGTARQAVAAGEAADGVVYFLPRTGTAAPKPGRFSVDTHSKGFLPGSLVVPVGSTIAFPNRDEILHNVYSATPGTRFDLGTYGPGQTRSTRFGKAGLVLVACNVHHGMRSNVLVLETPHYTRPGRDGRFELKNLPPGPGTLVFWHPRTAAQSRPIAVSAAPVMVRLTTVRSRTGTN